MAATWPRAAASQVIRALRYKPHKSHAHLALALQWIEQAKIFGETPQHGQRAKPAAPAA